jgi:short-subunit dehydrogenase involved in D-alanine esterification of teichoic acids
LTAEEIESQVNLNGLHPIYLAKALLPYLLGREKRSSIIVTSSGLGTVAVPGVLTYSMCKSFVSFLA